MECLPPFDQVKMRRSRLIPGDAFFATHYLPDLHPTVPYRYRVVNVVDLDNVTVETQAGPRTLSLVTGEIRNGDGATIPYHVYLIETPTHWSVL